MQAIRRLKRKPEDDLTTDNYLASKKFLSEKISHDIDVLRIDPDWDPRWQTELPPVNPFSVSPEKRRMVQRRARTQTVPTIEDWATPTDNLAANSAINSAYTSDPMIEDTPQSSHSTAHDRPWRSKSFVEGYLSDDDDRQPSSDDEDDEQATFKLADPVKRALAKSTTDDPLNKIIQKEFEEKGMALVLYRAPSERIITPDHIIEVAHKRAKEVIEKAQRHAREFSPQVRFLFELCIVIYMYTRLLSYSADVKNMDGVQIEDVDPADQGWEVEELSTSVDPSWSAVQPPRYGFGPGVNSNVHFVVDEPPSTSIYEMQQSGSDFRFQFNNNVPWGQQSNDQWSSGGFTPFPVPMATTTSGFQPRVEELDDFVPMDTDEPMEDATPHDENSGDRAEDPYMFM